MAARRPTSASPPSPARCWSSTASSTRPSIRDGGSQHIRNEMESRPTAAPASSSATDRSRSASSRASSATRSNAATPCSSTAPSARYGIPPATGATSPEPLGRWSWPSSPWSQDLVAEARQTLSACTVSGTSWARTDHSCSTALSAKASDPPRRWSADASFDKARWSACVAPRTIGQPSKWKSAGAVHQLEIVRDRLEARNRVDGDAQALDAALSAAAMRSSSH